MINETMAGGLFFIAAIVALILYAAHRERERKSSAAYQGLYNWYVGAIAKHKQSVQKSYRRPYVEVYFGLAVGMFGFMFNVYNNAPVLDLFFGTVLFLLVFLIRTLPTIIMYKSAQAEVEANINRIKRTSKPIPTTKLPAVWGIIGPLQQEMGLAEYSLTVYFLAQNQALPFVYIDGQDISLFVPRTTSYLATTNPPAFQALIAHEFGHVKQGDGKTHLIEAHYAEKRLNLAIAMASLSAAAILAFYEYYNLDINWNIIGLLSGVSLASLYLIGTSKRRHAMELMADAATVLYAPPAAMEYVLRNYTRSATGLFPAYPSTETRIQHLQHLQKCTAELYVQPAQPTPQLA